MTDPRRVAVIGAGVVGLSCAWRLAVAGHHVTVHDPDPGGGATRAAAGMLAPASEAVHGQDALLAAGLEAARQWPAFAAALSRDSGHELVVSPRSTLLVALDADDGALLARHARHLEARGCLVELLSSRAARQLEPALSPRVSAAIRLPEGAVDPRRATEALVAAVVARGGTLSRGSVVPVVRDRRVTGVRLLPPGSEQDARAGESEHADVVVVAAGWASPSVSGALGHPVPIRPLKGQVLRLAAAPDALAHTVRATVRGREVYVVPRPDGEVVAGATSEDVGPDTTVTAGAVHDLLHDAIDVVPELAEARLCETTAGLRPATPDNLPLVGPTCVEGLLLASGHGRDGVLLAPATADAVVAHVAGSPPTPPLQPLDPRRLCPKEHP